MIKAVIIILTIFLAPITYCNAQQPITLNAAEIFLRLKKLSVLGSVLYVAAHPDDENSRLLPYLSEEKLYRTGYLSMTRGDGGQNLIGDEQGVELGLIRTQEMLAARRIDGAEQFFTRAFDFGFTKTTEEAMTTWGKEKTLSDLVWVIRNFSPDVIITRFPEDVRAGHGHHSASAVLAHDAFVAAADSTRFPEQFAYGVKPWQAKRLLWNTFNFGGVNTTGEDQVKIDVGGYNALLAKSYGEIAADSRSQHKTQGAALTRTRGEAYEYFKMVAGEPLKDDLMNGVNTSWTRITGGNAMAAQVNQLIVNYSLVSPEKSIPGLVELSKRLKTLPDSYWKAQKYKEVSQLIEQCAGLWMEATVHSGYAVQGEKLSIMTSTNNRGGCHCELERMIIGSSAGGKQNEVDHHVDDQYKIDTSHNQLDTTLRWVLNKNKNNTLNYTFIVSTTEPATQPYWLLHQMLAGSYSVNNQLLIGRPEGEPAFKVTFLVRVDGELFSFTRPVQYKYTDPVQGELYEPLTVLPPMTGRIDPELVVFPSREEKLFQVRTKDETATGKIANISLTNTEGLILEKQNDLLGPNIGFLAKPVSSESRSFISNLTFDINGKTESAKELKTLSYNHIPRIDYFKPSQAKFLIANIRISGKRIGYIEGAGDRVPQALLQMGYEVVVLKEKDITLMNIKQFDAILTGIRAYNVHQWLSDKFEVLSGYVKGGGNLIVQYNTNNQAGPFKIALSPYPFTIGRSRVTDENAHVTFLLPDHPVLNHPNKITSTDFEGWIQERGIYFAEQADPKFESVLSMHDAGEQDQKGSLIIAKLGLGTFVYTGLAFFRELPAGVPGAYRLLANIIALNQK